MKQCILVAAFLITCRPGNVHISGAFNCIVSVSVSGLCYVKITQFPAQLHFYPMSMLFENRRDNVVAFKKNRV